MGLWNVLEWAAWAISAGLMLWMLVDAARVGASYDERTLLSSREGVDELFTKDAEKP